MLPILLTLAALAMPVIAWLSQEGRFGPDNKTLSDQFPTLLVADGYAFSIWGVIFLLDLLLALWTLRGQRPVSAPGLAAVRHRCLVLMTAGFALTASWMVVFSQRWFWLALAIIWGALICLLWALMLVAHARPAGASAWMTLLPLGLHAGWLSLAAFLNTAQVIVAQQLLPTADQLPWTLVLWALAALLLLVAIARLHQPMSAWPALAYVVAVVWGLVGVYVKQTRNDLAGAQTSAWIALALAGVVVAQTLWLRLRGGRPPTEKDEGLMSYRPH
ncbi:hypothetical protein SAMN05216359_101197 [Roseateles sp. YR242]|uniref:hypothetical protein n=1 Tax=Roseateles sp. YR242 TaxID=1855305 RepID=UPI0008B9890E|nr:hypothetical protein [Roseateles sp. YR242]SEK25596.1 hypothetical protein SAMN05216359_101197 [Roseateles sp. YR242]